MLHTYVRFIISALVLMLVGYLVPGVSATGSSGALVAAVVIAVTGYVIERFLGDNISHLSRGIVGFVTAVVVIYLAQFVVPQYHVSIFGSLLAAVVIGLAAFATDLVSNPTKIR